MVASALLDSFSSALETVNLEKLRSRYPDAEIEAKYKSAREYLGVVLAEVDSAKKLRTSTLEKLKKCEENFIALSERLSPSSELGSRSQLNKIYGWVDAGYVERTIYLAGMADGKKIRQPYRTQIRLLPCSACLLRYRQTYNVWEELKNNLSENVSGTAILKLETIMDAYMAQMRHFAEEAYEENQEHPLSTYYMVLSALIFSNHAKKSGDNSLAEVYIRKANLHADRLPEPRAGMHYMHRQYHIMNHEEFASFRRLSREHPQVSSILARNFRKSKELRDHDLSYPRTTFEFVPYVAIGTRGAASVASVAAAVAAAYAMDFGPVQELISNIWNQSVSLIPGMNEVDASMVASIHGGGPALVHGGGPAA